MRALVAQMRAEGERHLGFYGAMGYDLVFQFEPIDLQHQRAVDQPDMHLFLPDELVVVDVFFLLLIQNLQLNIYLKNQKIMLLIYYL